MYGNKVTGNGGMNMGKVPTDKIKSSLARPNMSMKPSLTHVATKKGKNFMPKGMTKSK